MPLHGEVLPSNSRTTPCTNAVLDPTQFLLDTCSGKGASQEGLLDPPWIPGGCRFIENCSPDYHPADHEMRTTVA